MTHDLAVVRHATDYIAALIQDFTPLAGDRAFSDDAAVVGGMGRFRGRAVVVLRPGMHCTAPELIAWCRAEMANYKVPREVLFVDSLPVNAAGKVTKFQLKAWQAEEHS